jgi:integrase
MIDVKRRCDLAKSDAGIKDFRFHDLRHTAAARMREAARSLIALWFGQGDYLGRLG